MSIVAPPSRQVIAAIRHRVQPVEIDGFQVVHFSNYMRWYSSAMIAAFEGRGLGPGRFCGGRIEIRVGRVQAAYISSARLGDEVLVEVVDIANKRNGLQIAMRSSVEGRLLSRARLSVAFVETGSGKLAPAPEDVVAALSGDNETLRLIV